MWISVISTHLGFGFEPSKVLKFHADVAELADALVFRQRNDSGLSATDFLFIYHVELFVKSPPRF